MATTLRRAGCTLIVEIRLEFQNSTGRVNAAQFAALVNGCESSSEALWNGPAGSQRYRCCSVRFDAITRIGRGTPGFHQVNVHPGPRTSSSGVGPGSRNANWDDQDNGNVAAHETGHLMGLHDEYDYGGPGGAYRNLNPQPAGQPQSIMAQTWGNVAALQSHIDAIMRGLNASCPWWCCVFFWVVYVFRLIPIPDLPPIPDPGPKAGVDIVRSAQMPETGALAARSVAEILQDVERGDPHMLAAAVDALAVKGRDATAQLREEMRNPNPLRRWAAVAALVRAANPDTADALRAALGDQSASVRAMAAYGLAQIRIADGVSALIGMLGSEEVMIGHPPQLIREFAAEALQSATGRAVAPGLVGKPGEWQEWWQQNQGNFGRR